MCVSLITCFLLARDVIYTSRAYATMSVSVCLSVTEVHWRIIANLRFKFRSKFTAHCCSGEGSSQQHLALVTCFLFHFSCIFSFRIAPLQFPTGCRRRRLNLDYCFFEGSILLCCIFVFRMHYNFCWYMFNFVLWCEGCLSLLSRVRTVHEKTDRTQSPSFRPQFRPTQYPIRFTRRASPASPAYFSITPLVRSPAKVV